MSVSDIGGQSLAQFLDGVRRGRTFGEHSVMNIAEGKFSSPAQLDPAFHCREVRSKEEL
jgi:hypothetical protein